MLNFSHFDSLFSLVCFFNSTEICKNFLAQQRWGDDVVCPYCGEHHCSRCKDGRFNCKCCDHKFGVTVGTIFENSKISLQKWFMAIYLVSSHKKGISSHQLGRDIKVTQKTAWFMLMKIRSCFSHNESVSFDGEVEMDEAYIGGDNKWRHESKKKPHGQGGANKTAIFGLLERKNGNVVAVKVENTTRDTIFPIVQKYVEVSGTIVYTDEAHIYDALGEKCGLAHLSCNHGEGLFSDGDKNYTNGIEGFWSHFKRMVKGVYHHVSEAHIQSYIDEECFRWNSRKESEGRRFEKVFNACVGRVTYADVKAA